MRIISKRTFSLLQHFCQKIHGLIFGLRNDIWIVSGNGPMKTPLSIVYAGQEVHKNYIAKIAFDSSYSELYIGREWLWNLFRIIRKSLHGCDIMVLEVNKALYRLVKSSKSFFIPFWIGGEADISSIVKSDSFKSDIKKIRKCNLEVELTQDWYQFDNFYTTMYLPHITKVHGNRAILMPYREMEKNYPKCELLLVKKGKEYIAGVLINYGAGDRPHLWHVGIKSGNNCDGEADALGAAGYFALGYAYLKQKGYKKINFGSARAFLKDGVLEYKKKRGLCMTGSTNNGFLMKPLSSSNGTKEFFLNNPFICVEHDISAGTIFIESDRLTSEKDFKRLYKDYYLKGLSHLCVYLFGGSEKEIAEHIPPELSGRISVLSAAGRL